MAKKEITYTEAMNEIEQILDRFRRDLGNVEDAYIEIRKRLMGE